LSPYGEYEPYKKHNIF